VAGVVIPEQVPASSRQYASARTGQWARLGPLDAAGPQNADYSINGSYQYQPPLLSKRGNDSGEVHPLDDILSSMASVATASSALGRAPHRLL
jgi:hypothetical protein